MRLTDYEVKSITKAFSETFADGKIILFGSRTDDTKRGGDIDLYICPAKKSDNESIVKRDFSIKLDEYLGEQKIDIVIAKDKNRLIEQEAIKYGIEL
jgi:predicted nucleotidyltransferase